MPEEIWADNLSCTDFKMSGLTRICCILVQGTLYTMRTCILSVFKFGTNYLGDWNVDGKILPNSIRSISCQSVAGNPRAFLCKLHELKINLSRIDSTVTSMYSPLPLYASHADLLLRCTSNFGLAYKRKDTSRCEVDNAVRFSIRAPEGTHAYVLRILHAVIRKAHT